MYLFMKSERAYLKEKLGFWNYTVQEVSDFSKDEQILGCRMTDSPF